MFCPKCGTQLEAFEAFCHSCGYRVTKEAPATSVAQEPVFPAAAPASQEPAPAAQEPVFPAAAPASQEPAPAAQEEVVAPKKKSKKKLIIGITAAVTALAVGIGAVAFYFVNHPKVYLRTKVTKYDENGDWYQTIEYDYNDQGSPTEIKRTSPDYDYEYTMTEGIEIQTRVPNGGKIVKTLTYEYNDEGHCVSYENLYESFDVNGKLVEKTVQDSTEKYNYDYDYSYNKDGTIDAVKYRTPSFDGQYHDYEYEYVYHYDDEGRLHEISLQSLNSEYKRPIADFRYDRKGRLTASSVRQLEAMRLCQYEYDKDGNLEKVLFTMAYCEAPFDNEHITGMDKDEWPSALGEPDTEIEFKYDEKGRLVSRGWYDENGEWLEDASLEYDGKFLSRVEYPGEAGQRVFEITSDEDEAEEIADSMGKEDLAMVRDKHGNIIKVIAADGAYAEYEYEAVRLSKTLAQQHNSIMFSVHRIDLRGYQVYSTLDYTGGCGLYSYVSFPTNELYEIEVILNANY